jgi:ribulose-5-phosphate 4-epimerase/fuculose-1-phosphate aldolase
LSDTLLNLWRYAVTPVGETVEKDLRERLATVGRKLFEQGLTQGSSGNISARIAGTSVCLIKESGRSFADLRPEHFLAVDINTRALVKDSGNPSIEVPFHTSLYKVRDDIGGVVHVHPHYGTILSIAGVEIVPLGMGVYRAPSLARGVGIARFAPPGSEELARNLVEAMTGKTAVLMPHHGVTTVGTTVEEAANTAIVLEEMARLQYEVLQIGRPQPLPEQFLRDLTEVAKKRDGSG